jgi:hypothetical protein
LDGSLGSGWDVVRFLLGLESTSEYADATAGEPHQSIFTESTPHQKINLEKNIAAAL